jgi:hypothetical protein
MLRHVICQVVTHVSEIYTTLSSEYNTRQDQCTMKTDATCTSKAPVTIYLTPQHQITEGSSIPEKNLFPLGCLLTRFRTRDLYNTKLHTVKSKRTGNYPCNRPWRPIGL